MMDFDVIIVGAGPAGTSCAITTARGGMKTLLCDKARFPRHKICGDCVNPAAWPLLEQLGVAEKIRGSGGAAIRRVRVSNARGTTIQAPVPDHAAGPFFAMERSKFDAALLLEAERRHAEVLERAPVKEIAWDGAWNVRIGSRIVRGRFLVGADGRNSIIARKFGRTAKNRGDAVRVGVQWLSSFQPSIDSAVHLFLFAHGYCGVVNVDDRHANIAMVTTPELAQLSRTNFFLFLTKTLFNNPAAREIFDTLSPVTPLSAAFPIDPSFSDCIHPAASLVGDARRTLEPFTGEGICSAMRDGVDRAQSILRIGPGEGHIRRTNVKMNSLFSYVLRRPMLASRFVELGTILPSTVSPVINSVLADR